MKGTINNSIFDLFKIGPGPSSSHTIGPMKAAHRFLVFMNELPGEKLRSATAVDVHLFGSLSATGRGHGTDRAILGGLLGWRPETCDTTELSGLLRDPDASYIIKVPGTRVPFTSRNIHFDKICHSHPFSNTMIFRLTSGKSLLLEKIFYSVGGGFIKCKGEADDIRPDPPYRYNNMSSFVEAMVAGGVCLRELMLRNEEAVSGNGRGRILAGMDEIISAMESSVERGIHSEGVLPGPIGLARKAPVLYRHARCHKQGRRHSLKHLPDRFMVFIDAYAHAASEENAAGHRMVTAPTSGSAGVIPAIIYLLRHHFNTPDRILREGLLAAAAIGLIVKKNASISGAEVGCQGEIGVASAMASGMLAHINGHKINIMENAAEIALEHQLGMTCDPVGGYVQIPCIERNAISAVTAYNAYLLASAGDPRKQKIRFDEVVDAMLETGRDMCSKYKETSKGGLAVCTITC